MRRTVVVSVGAGVGAVLLAVGVVVGGAVAASGAGGAVATPSRAVAAAVAAAPPNQPSASESSFVPVAPCRIVDTRLGGGKVAKNATRSFYVGGTFGFKPQGGKTSGCGVPVGASAVVVSVATMTGSKAGYFTAYPTGKVSTSGFVNITPGRTERAAGTFALAAGSGKTLTVKNTSAGSANIVIDVQGYYVRPIQATVAADGALQPGSSRVVSVEHSGTGVYWLAFDQNSLLCIPMVSIDGGPKQLFPTVSYPFGGDHYFGVHITDVAGNPVDSYFFFRLSC